jgi:hypothetical protein
MYLNRENNNLETFPVGDEWLQISSLSEGESANIHIISININSLRENAYSPQSANQ